MKPECLEKYVEIIYSWSRGKTFSEDEAEDLSQEILYQAVLGLPKLKDESRFEPWLWGLASNCAKAFRRKKGKERARYLYNVSEDEITEAEMPDEDEELYGDLREKISMLSKSYRDVIMMYYYDGLSTKEISQILTIPEGTVTWRLSEARRKLKKECQNMEESALRPVELHLDIYGSGEYGERNPFPYVYINSALEQNILWQCYEQALDVEELSKICGVPSYYIEDTVKNLLERNALIEVKKGKYRTDFIIWTDKHGDYCEKYGAMSLEPINEELMSALQEFYKGAERLSFYHAGRCNEELKHLLGVMAFDTIEEKYGKLEYPEIPINYDGYRWRYIASNENTDKRLFIGRQVCRPFADGVPYKHLVYWRTGFAGRNIMYQSEIRACWSLLEPDIPCEKDWMTLALQRGFIERKGEGDFKVTVPVFTKEQKDAFDSLVDETLGKVALKYVECVRMFVKGYQSLFPKHLEDDVKRMCKGMVLSLYEVVSTLAIKKGILTEPKTEWICDVLIRN